MKKNSTLLLRIPDQDRDALHAHARAAGLTLSDLIRSLAERELSRAELMGGLTPTPVGEEPALTRRVIDPQGRTWLIRLHTDGVWPYLHLVGGDQITMPIEGPKVLPSGPLGPALDAYRSEGRAEFDWEMPEFRRICDAFRLDPDRIRPRYRPRDRDLVEALKRLLLGPQDPVNKPVALTLLRMLRTDQDTSLEDWERAMERGSFHEARLAHPLLRRAGRRARPPRKLTIDQGMTVLQILPCRSDVGMKGLFYAGMSYDRVRPGLVAVPPNLHMHKNRVLVRKLTRAGVRFVPEEEVSAYMRAEGDAWRDRLLDFPGPAKRALRWSRRTLRKLIELHLLFRNQKKKVGYA